MTSSILNDVIERRNTEKFSGKGFITYGVICSFVSVVSIVDSVYLAAIITLPLAILFYSVGVVLLRSCQHNILYKAVTKMGMKFNKMRGAYNV